VDPGYNISLLVGIFACWYFLHLQFIETSAKCF